MQKLSASGVDNMPTLSMSTPTEQGCPVGDAIGPTVAPTVVKQFAESWRLDPHSRELLNSLSHRALQVVLRDFCVPRKHLRKSAKVNARFMKYAQSVKLTQH